MFCKGLKHKSILTILLLAMLLIFTLILSSCTGDPVVQKFTVQVNANQFIGLESLDVSISAVNGIPLEDKEQSGTFKQGDNVEISLKINNAFSHKQYKFIVKDGSVKLKELMGPDNRYVIENLSQSRVLNVDLEIVDDGSTDENGDNNRPDDLGVCTYQIRTLCNGSQIADPIDGNIRIGLTTVITAPDFMGTPNIYKYRFKRWATGSSLDVEGKITPTVNIVTNDDTELVFIAEYVELVEVKLGENSIINENLSHDKNDNKLIDLYKYSLRDIDGKTTWYLAPEDKIRLEYDFDNLNYRFDGWYKSNDNYISRRPYIDIVINQDANLNNYYAKSIEQIVVNKKGTLGERIDKNSSYYIELADSEIPNSITINGQKTTNLKYEVKDYKMYLVLDRLTENTEYELESGLAYTLYTYNCNAGDGYGYNIQKYPFHETTQIVVNSSVENLIGWSLDDKLQAQTGNSFTINQAMLNAAAQNQTYKLELEAVVKPKFTNESGQITSDVIIDNEKNRMSIGNSGFKQLSYRNNFYLPGLKDSESLLVEAVTKIDITSSKSTLLLGGYVVTNNSNKDIVKNHGSYLILMEPTSDLGSASSTIQKIIEIKDDIKISCILEYNNKILIGSYTDGNIYSISKNDVVKTKSYSKVSLNKEFTTCLSSITSLSFNFTYKEIMVGGLLRDDIQEIEHSNEQSFIVSYNAYTNLSKEEELLYNDLGVNCEREIIKNNEHVLIPNSFYKLADLNYGKYVSTVQSVDCNGSEIYLLIGPNDKFGVENNEPTKLYKFNYYDLCINPESKSINNFNCSYYDITSLTNENANVTTSLPPLIREMYVEKKTGGNTYFVSIGATFVRHLPSIATQCQNPISKILIASTNLF